ncbi:beta-ketoacyl synthase N-terminal-like domain-containing protein [Micromonospora sp. NPDC049559]|uniref:beta-ketoacyl synthase N-terminal-like domain-containing protein n=1 Tax=Micromonospora sp. NPDC049559 TaxID=3155923 RepID=UPI00342534B9
MGRDRDGAGRVAVTVSGLGAVSVAGLGVDALWAAVTGGRVLTRPVTRFDLAGYPADRGGQVPDDAISALDALVPPHRSLAGRYLAAAALEALRDAGLPPAPRRERLGLFVGTVMATRPLLDRGIGPGRLGVPGDGWARPDDLLAALRRAVAVNGPVVLLAPGCAAGNSAIAAGHAAVATGEVDVAICAGASELSLEIFAMFTSLRALASDVVRPFDRQRRGTMPGEGAGVLVLERAERAAARGARPLARVLGTARAADAHNPTRPHPDGVALISTLHSCLRQAGLDPEDVDWVCAHGTGTPASDGTEARALARSLTGRRPPAVSSVKGQLGHAEGAGAALEAVISVRALGEDFMPGNVTLREPDPACAGVDLVEPAGRRGPLRVVASPAFGFGGGVSTVLFGRATDGRSDAATAATGVAGRVGRVGPDAG